MYPIYKNRLLNKKIDYVILSQAINFIDPRIYIDPSVYSDDYNTFLWGIWQNYFLHKLGKKKLPCHYFCEFIDKDYVIYQGLSEELQSDLVKELVIDGVIETKYKNSLMIFVADNLVKHNPNERMYRQLCSKTICSIMRRYNLDFTRIKYIDQCLTEDWEKNSILSDKAYNIKPTNFFDSVTLKTFIDEYKR